jgi:two-component system, cell cycle sensor histidine kinase and response regulator CckA
VSDTPLKATDVDDGIGRSIADALPVGIWVAKAPGGELVYANAMFAEIMGQAALSDVTAGEYTQPYGIYGKDGQLYPEEKLPFPRVLAEKRPVVIDDIVIHRRDGSRVHIRAQARPVLDESGAVIRIIIAFIDITREAEAELARAESEERLRHAQRMESIGRLAGGVAHDFNNLLAAIGILAASLKRSETDASRKSALDQIEQTTDSAAALTRSLLGFAGQGKNLRRPVSLTEVVDRVAALFARTIDPRVSVQKDTTSKQFVVGDPTQIEQVVLNLVVNGRDAMPDGGVLAIRAYDLAPDAPRPRGGKGLPRGKWLILEVEDTGTGIDPSIRHRIFEPYFTTKQAMTQPGAGLGLATVYGIVEAHGGTIELLDGEPRGTLVRVAFPVGSGMMRLIPSDRAPMVEEELASPARIMIVEDDALVRGALRRGLGDLGFVVTTAQDGQDAAEIFQKDHRSIDVVLLDMSMPRMNGRAAFEALKRFDPEVRAVLMTGHALNEDAQAILDLGVRAFFEKPFSLRAVAAKLHELARERVLVREADERQRR